MLTARNMAAMRLMSRNFSQRAVLRTRNCAPANLATRSNDFFLPNASTRCSEQGISSLFAPVGVRHMSSSSQPEDFVQNEIESNKVVVFSKTYCPYCRMTKGIFEKLGVEYKVFELDEMADGPDIQAALLTITGQRSVPNVFVNKEHIGGNDDAQASFRNGSLETKLGLSK